MLTPPQMYSDMPTLVEPSSPFQPPPPGVSQGGQPGGFYDAFPGSAPHHQNPPWPPFPHSAGSAFPNGWPGGPPPPQPPPNPAPPNTTPWPFGAPHQHYYPQFNTPPLTWGAATPAGSYGPPQTPTSGGPHGGIGAAGGAGGGAGGGAYAPWSAPQVFGGAGADYSAFAQAIPPAGFYGAPAGPTHTGNNHKSNKGAWGETRKEQKRRKRMASLKRSTSEGPGPEAAHRKSHIQRSNSFGNLGSSPFGAPTAPAPGGTGAGVFGYQPWGYYPPPPPYLMYNDEYGPKNLARRPRDWRADYSPRGGLASYFPSIGKSRSDVQEITDPTRRNLHPLLQHTPTRPPINHDLRSNPISPSPTSTHTLFPNLNRPHNNIDFAQLATTPPASFMRLSHPSLPWYIDIRQSHPNGITVYDVLAHLYRQMMQPIRGRHYWNEELGEEERRSVCRAFERRCRVQPGEVGRGVVYVDFLGEKVGFEGLARGKGGMWEIKTGRVG